MFKFLSNLFFISLMLDFVWEISQMPFYSGVGMGIRNDYSEFLKIHWQVSLKDALMVISAYCVIGFLLRNWRWAARWNYGWMMLWIALPAWQVAVEYYSVYVAHRWAYADAMPLISGIGLLPMLQMLVLPGIALFLSRHLLKR